MWKHISYAQQGLSHKADGLECQDSVRIYEDSQCIVAALADGLGSLKHSALASGTATMVVCDWFRALGDKKLFLDTQEQKAQFQSELVRTVADAVRGAAAEKQLNIKTLDCTLAFAYISKVHSYALTGMIGDSAVCVIMENDAVAITDSSGSANGTHAVLDPDAAETMLLSFWELEQQKVLGFILTSDGLDNELYVKGSSHVNKAAQDYFNSLTQPHPEKLVKDRINKLTGYKDTLFDDDISIAIVSRADGPITMKADPTWLCVCGYRNKLQNTYCAECNQDFTKLYRNVRFRDHGGKAAFFERLNQDAAKERELLGLAPLPVSPKAVPAPESASSEKKNTPAKKETASQPGMKKPPVLAIALLVAGLVVGFLGGSLMGGQKADPEQPDTAALQAQIQSLQQELERLNSEPAETQAQIAPVDDFHVLDDGSYYWGAMEHGQPEGMGILQVDGSYYVGSFKDGLRHGTFTVISGDEAETVTQEVFAMGEPVEEPAALGEACVVTGDRVNIRDAAGTADGQIITQVFMGEVVYATGNTASVSDEEWVEIYWEDGTAWIVSGKLRSQTAMQQVYRVNTTKLNVRNQPGTGDSQVIGALYLDDEVYATGAEETIDSGKWIEIQWETGTAWVLSTNLQLLEP